MLPFGRLLGGAYDLATLVGSISGTTTAPASAGAIPGDLLVSMGGPPASSGAGSWTGVASEMFFKKADQADVANPLTNSAICAIFRGASSMVVRNVVSQGTVTLGGFTRAFDHVGLFAFEDSQGGSGPGTVSTGGVNLTTAANYISAGHGLQLSALVKPGRYVDRANLTWAQGTQGNGYAAMLSVGELIF